MLFNSHEFIFLFLPIAFLGFLAARRLAGDTVAYGWLTAVSLFFGAWWNSADGIVLVLSVVFNYAVARAIARARGGGRSSVAWLTVGIAGNLAALAYFKYVNFFIDNANAFLAEPLPALAVALPLGVSFFTFQQIAYLVDAHNGDVADRGIVRFALFVTFFPKLIAGPLVRHRDMPLPAASGFTAERVAIGLSVFALGLFQKVTLADGIAPYATAMFNAAGSGAAVSGLDAWLGTIAYALQLFFDFAGYSDMAIGLGYLFGISLPLNFNAPYRATSIIDFWRRWHMTMTRFFTTYVYAPLALGLVRRCTRRSYGRAPAFMLGVALPVVVTFAVSGLWHGAGWGFVAWGLLHGVALVVNRAWRAWRMPAVPTPIAWALTMAVVVIGLVPFRAERLDVTAAILRAMSGLSAGAEARLDPMAVVPWILVLAAIAIVAPSSHELMREFPVSSDASEPTARRWPAWLVWRPTLWWAAVSVFALMIAVFSITGRAEFLYYRF